MSCQTHHHSATEKPLFFIPLPIFLLPLSQAKLSLSSLNLLCSCFWLACLSEPPRPLSHLCRIKVRSLVGRNRIKLLDTLPLPDRLIRYLQHDYTQWPQAHWTHSSFLAWHAVSSAWRGQTSAWWGGIAAGLVKQPPVTNLREIWRRQRARHRTVIRFSKRKHTWFTSELCL